jgi:hypothetical protein
MRRAAAGAVALALPLGAAWLGTGSATAKTYRVTEARDFAAAGTLRRSIARANEHRGHDRVVITKHARGGAQVRDDIKITDALTLIGRRRGGISLVGVPGGRVARPRLSFRDANQARARLTVRRLHSRNIGITATRAVITHSAFKLTRKPTYQENGITLGHSGTVADTKLTGWWAGVSASDDADGLTRIRNSLLTGNWIGVDGGEYGDTVIEGSTIQRNRRGLDLDFGTGTATVTESSVRGNRPRGGIHALFGPDLLVDRSTISGNAGGRGGGLMLMRTDATITNSTISGNLANGAEGYDPVGGAIYAGLSHRLVVRATTITGNSASQGGGIYFGGGVILGHDYTGRARVESAIVAANSALGGRECAFADPAEAPPSHGGNVFGPDGCGTADPSDILTADPGLGPLTDNGGPTMTHALLPGSPAIGNGIDLGLATDQRGALRDSQPDSGSFERQ